ncbi:hypothetical protein C8R46DRAFT_1057086 [Mycena filopes]|nr:hypothetical protein C8R46DRAFT_1057086 [Mycena filopes]
MTATLPLDLERLIFETTALQYPAAIPRLLRVSRRVLLWTEPLLYQTVRLDMNEGKGFGGRILSLLDTKSDDFWINAVKHLDVIGLDGLFGDRASPVWFNGGLRTLLRAFAGVQYLVAGEFSEKPFIPMLSHMRPVRIFLVGDFVRTPLDFTQPLFSAVTHLILWEIDHLPRVPIEADWFDWSALARLASLTHLAFTHPVPPNLTTRILRGMPRLKILLMHAVNEAAATVFSEQLLLHDDRVAMLDIRSFDAGMGVEYMSSTRAVNAVWTWADDFVARKRRGEIEASVYYMKPTEYRFEGRSP